jgi:branched-chain amino acid transport system permease protein
MAALSLPPFVRDPLRFGLIAGLVAASVSAIGMVQTFDARDVISGILTLGQLLLFSAPLIAGFLIVRRRAAGGSPVFSLVSGLVVGLLAALPVAGLVLLAVNAENIRSKLPNVSPQLVEILTFGEGLTNGLLLLVGIMAGLGLVGAVVGLLPQNVRRPLFLGILWTIVIGMLSEVLLGILRNLLEENATTVSRALFGTRGIRPIPAVIFLIVFAAIAVLWRSVGRGRVQALSSRRQPAQARRMRLGSMILLFVILLFLPAFLGRYLTQVLDNVGLYILMGLGLNIVVGFAGLLDLGYVAFYAIGAYTMGILTSTGALGLAQLSFWEALPVAVVASVLAGVLLGTPVLRMRGDYLAIVTLGFGEIIRVLAMSDLLKPYIGGAQGILSITKPSVPSAVVDSGRLVQPEQFYYLILAGCLLAAFVSWRLRDSRLGRQWMAMREDEDVAEAMGIHLVKTKLLAFAMGAAFSGLAGAIFASQIGSIYPHSFNLIISINVLSLIIVGGLGSLPGVVVGALVLVGLPELLREFAEYRYLMYGALLIAMMVTRPEGLWPSPIRRRELHQTGEVEESFPADAELHPVAEEAPANPLASTPKPIGD